MKNDSRFSTAPRRIGHIVAAGAVLCSAVIALNAQPLAHVQDTPGGPSYLKGQVLVEFDAAASDALLQDALRKASLHPLRSILTAAMKARGRNEISVLDTPMAVPAALALLRQHPAVKSAQPNWVYQHCETSNDPYYLQGNLWGMYGDATSPANPYGSQAGEAWARGTTGSRDVYVGVIDEGIMITHTDLAANIWTNPYDRQDGVDNDGNGYIDDVNGWDFYSNNNSVYDGSADDHGTHVAGTIGALGGNAAGVVGVNWKVTLISAKFLGPVSGSTADAIEAIDYFVDLKTRHGLNVVALNNSWGGGAYDEALLDAIGRAAGVGILFVAAAGNEGFNNDVTPSYPASYDHEAVVAVAAIDSAGALASFSNFGATSVDLGAPGVGIYSTVPNRQNKSTYASASGTSMATPHVTGAIALYAAAYPNATAAQIKNALLATTTPTSSLNGKTLTGGRLNVADLLQSPPTTKPTVTIDDPPDGATCPSGASISFLGTAFDEEDGDLTASLVWTAKLQGQETPLPIGVGGSVSASLGDGVYTVTASATDSAGATGTASITIGVGVVNDPPTVTIASPSASALFTDGRSIVFSGTASDAQDGDVTGSLVWTAKLDGPEDAITIGTGGSFSATLCDGTHTITASVTDSWGATGSATVTVTVDNSTAIVVPLDYHCAEAAGWSGTIAYPVRLQEVYSANHFGAVGPVTIYGMAFRMDHYLLSSAGAATEPSTQGAGATNQGPVQVLAAPGVTSVIGDVVSGSMELQVRLSSTAKAPDGLSATFSANIGADETVVLPRRQVTFTARTGATPNGFDIVVNFAKPFTYNPANGNLLVDITTYSPAASAAVDASNATTDGASRVVAQNNAATSGTPDTGADVIRFALLPPPNQPPVASFTHLAQGLAVSFTDTSVDSDGTIVGWSWDFGDGATSQEQNPSHTYATAGTYTVALTVWDDDGADDTANAEVTVADAPPALHGGDLDGKTATSRNTWTATVTVTIHDADHNLVSGALVTGAWSGGYTGTASGTTGPDGKISLTTGSMNTKKPSVTFTLTGVAKDGYSYDSSANHDPENDSNGTAITIYKP